MSNNISQKLKYKHSVIKFSLKYGVYNATKEEILEQSQKLDKYVLKKFKIINNKSLKSK